VVSAGSCQHRERGGRSGDLGFSHCSCILAFGQAAGGRRRAAIVWPGWQACPSSSGPSIWRRGSGRWLWSRSNRPSRCGWSGAWSVPSTMPSWWGWRAHSGAAGRQA